LDLLQVMCESIFVVQQTKKQDPQSHKQIKFIYMVHIHIYNIAASGPG